MEPKKNAASDVHRWRPLIFNFSLALSILIVICAFRWVAPVREPRVKPPSGPIVEDVFYPPVVNEKTPEKAAARKPVPVPIAVPRDFRIVDRVTEPDRHDVPDTSPQTDVPDFTGLQASPEIDSDTVFLIVEEMPAPVGGYQAFYKALGKTLRYPAKAKRMNVEGRVFVQFTVDENGKVQDPTILSGVGMGCDEEAIRVIRLSKWTAGKQRGRPVKVRMVQPITFELQ